MKKFFKNILCAILPCIFALASCVPAQEKGDPTLIWKDETVTVEYGDIYRLSGTAFDEENGEHATKAEVKTKDGETVIANGNKFTALEKEGYVITYTCTVGEKTLTRTVTVNVVAGAPVITYGTGLKVVYNGWPCDIPSVSAYDFYDGDVSASVTTKLFKKGAEGDEDLQYDGSGSYTFAEAGEYYMQASVTNAAGKTRTLDKPFTVTDQSELTDYIWKVDESTKNNISNGMSYVSASALEGVIEGDYKGNAMKRPIYGSLKHTLIYSLGNRDLSQYTHVAVWVAVDKFTEENMNMTSGYVMFSNGGKNTGLLGRVIDSNMRSFKAANSGVWTRALIKIEDFLALADGKDQIQLMDTRASGVKVRPNIYIGDITLVADMNYKDSVAEDKAWEL